MYCRILCVKDDIAWTHCMWGTNICLPYKMILERMIPRADRTLEIKEARCSERALQQALHGFWALWKMHGQGVLRVSRIPTEYMEVFVAHIHEREVVVRGYYVETLRIIWRSERLFFMTVVLKQCNSSAVKHSSTLDKNGKEQERTSLRLKHTRVSSSVVLLPGQLEIQSSVKGLEADKCSSLNPS